MVLGIMKTFGISNKEALYDISYTNAIMYSKAIPMLDDDKDKDENEPLYDDKLDANNVNNFNDFDNEETVRI